MNESEEVHEGGTDSPEKIVVPRTYRLGGRGSDPLFEFFLRLARFSLVFAQVVSVLSCIAILVFGIYELCVAMEREHGMHIICALVGTPVAFLYQFAMLVVFVKAAK